MILAALLTSAISTSRTNLKIARSQIDQFQLTQAMDAALEIAAFRASTDPKFLSTPNAVTEIEIDGIRVKIEHYTSHAPLDINRASEQKLISFFEFLGTTRETALKISAQALDWRDTDDLTRVNGAENKDYLHLAPDQRPQNRPFISVEEFAFLKDMTTDLFNCARPALSVISGSTQLGAELSRDLYGGLEDQNTSPDRTELNTSNRSIRQGTNISFVATPIAKAKMISQRKLIGIARATNRQNYTHSWITKVFSSSFNKPSSPNCSINTE